MLLVLWWLAGHLLRSAGLFREHRVLGRHHRGERARDSREVGAQDDDDADGKGLLLLLLLP